jgi:hypothetical protein
LGHDTKTALLGGSPTDALGGIAAVGGDITGIHQSNTIDPIKGIPGAIENAVTLGLKEGMYAMAILGGGMLILLGLLFIGVDIGLSSLSQRASNHPVVRLANRATPNRGGSAGPVVEDTSSSTLPGPEA